MQSLGEEVFAEVFPEFPLDAAEGHPVHLLQAGLGPVLLDPLLDDGVHLLLHFIVSDGDAVFDGFREDKFFVHHRLQHLRPQPRGGGIDFVVECIELDLGIQLRLEYQVVVDGRHDPVQGLRIRADRKGDGAREEDCLHDFCTPIDGGRSPGSPGGIHT